MTPQIMPSPLPPPPMHTSDNIMSKEIYIFLIIIFCAFLLNTDFGVVFSMQLSAGAQQVKAVPAASGGRAGTPGA